MQAFLDGLPSGGVAISPWTMTEFHSAIALKQRTGALDANGCVAATVEWGVFVATVRPIRIDERHFEQAGLFCRYHDLAIRAGDALHLAIASRAGCTLVTLDERMAKAALHLSVPVAKL